MPSLHKGSYVQFLMKCRNGQTVCQNGSHGFVKLNLITRINSNNDVLSSSETYHRMVSVYDEQRRLKINK